MLNIYTVSFFGHRFVNNAIYIERRIENLIKELLSTNEYVEFLVGRNGEFDLLVASVIERLKKEFRDDNCSHILVLPYYTAEYRDNQEAFNSYYDDVDIYESSSTAHFKSAFQKRNREMIDRSDLCVFYIDRNQWGAYQTYKYADKLGKNIIKINSER